MSTKIFFKKQFSSIILLNIKFPVWCSVVFFVFVDVIIVSLINIGPHK